MIFEYIWIDGDGDLRSKTRVLRDSDKIPSWNFDGSSTNQATPEKSDVLIKPVFTCLDPFRIEGEGTLVLCDTWIDENTPHPTNTRVKANEFFEKHKESKPQLGFEQEFFLKGCDDVENPHYCHVNGDHYIDQVFQHCIKAGLSITGMNSEVAPNQWELQVCDFGVNACDQLWILRYMIRKTFYNVNFHPKPFITENGSGCHVNFSTEMMRDNDNNYDTEKIMDKFKESHEEDLKSYGKFNELRLLGTHETSDPTKFTWGKGDRTASIRINDGYFEDRRPGSNIDPYVVAPIILKKVV